MKCFKCDKEIPEGSKFCNYCGCETKMNCPACGNVIPGGSKFCNHCGRPTSVKYEYIDLGLPSGTKWKAVNEGNLYEFDDAIKRYDINLPTKEQWEELQNQCQWEWMGEEYRVTGPNGNSIILPCGFYWSSTLNGSSSAWCLGGFSSGSVNMNHDSRYRGNSVRLVQN